MPTLPLTDTIIRAAKADQNKRLEITDAKCQGLEIARNRRQVVRVPVPVEARRQ